MNVVVRYLCRQDGRRVGEIVEIPMTPMVEGSIAAGRIELVAETKTAEDRP